MSSEENKALLRRSYEAMNQGNLAAYHELVASDVVFDSGSLTIQGLEAYQQWYSMYQAAFPDNHFTVEHLMAEGDMAAALHTYRATHTGDLMGIPATGKHITETGIVFARLVNGKFVEIWLSFDTMDMMQQLGVVPSMG